MCETIAAVIASDYATDLPELEVVQECVVCYSDSAHEEFIEVVGGCQFFERPFPFLDSFSFGSTSGMR